MRIAALLTLPILAVMVAVPTKASGQTISVTFGTRLGPEVGVFAYSQERHGDWRRNYRRWKPVTLYDINGHYYRNQVTGARAVLIYTYNNEYFFPPHDQGWNGADRRYNYGRKPIEQDYGRAYPYSPGAISIDARFGGEVGVLGYSPERAGPWRTNYQRWTPVTLYEINGRYYPKSGPGARTVAVYRYGNEYFLPPTDQDWVSHDKRYDYGHRPNQDDHGRVRDRP